MAPVAGLVAFPLRSPGVAVVSTGEPSPAAEAAVEVLIAVVGVDRIAIRPAGHHAGTAGVGTLMPVVRLIAAPAPAPGVIVARIRGPNPAADIALGVIDAVVAVEGVAFRLGGYQGTAAEVGAPVPMAAAVRGPIRSPGVCMRFGCLLRRSRQQAER